MLEIYFGYFILKNIFSFSDLDGYINSFSNFKSLAGNEGYDVKFQVSQTEHVTIKILKNNNRTITDSYLNNLKQAGEPLAIKKLNRGTKGVLFFNTSRGSKIQPSNNVSFVINNNSVTKINCIKSELSGEFDVIGRIGWLEGKRVVQSGNETKVLRDAVLFDESDNILITIWENLLETVDESHCYCFHGVVLKNYFGLKLSTTKSTFVDVINDDSINENINVSEEVLTQYRESRQDLNVKLNPTLCCPKIHNMCLNVYPGCTNPSCQKQVSIMPLQKSVTCVHCNHFMRADLCSSVFECKVGFERNSLKLPLHVLTEFLGEDVLKECKEDLDGFKDRLVFLENIDYTYNTKDVITSMKNHEQKE